MPACLGALAVEDLALHQAVGDAQQIVGHVVAEEGLFGHRGSQFEESKLLDPRLFGAVESRQRHCAGGVVHRTW